MAEAGRRKNRRLNESNKKCRNHVNSRSTKKPKRKLIRLVNGHYRRVVSLSMLNDDAGLFNCYGCCSAVNENYGNNAITISNASESKRTSFNKRKSFFTEKPVVDTGSSRNSSNQMNKIPTVTYLDTQVSANITQEEQNEVKNFFTTSSPDNVLSQLSSYTSKDLSIDIHSETEADTVPATKDSDYADDKGDIEKEAQTEIQEAIKAKEDEDEEEKAKEDEEKAKEDEEEKEKENFDLNIPRRERKTGTVDPSKLLMKGVMVHVYFITNRAVINAIMCFNYKCNVIIFQKGSYFRYLYLKHVTCFILSAREIKDVCKMHNFSYVSPKNSVSVVSSDFVNPLIIEFGSYAVRKIFVTQVKHIVQKEINLDKYDQMLELLDQNQKMRLKKVERFHKVEQLMNGH